MNSSLPARRAARFIVLSEDIAPSSTREREADRGNRLMWRIVAANNRPLGRSAATFVDFNTCLAGATQLHERSPDTRSVVTFDRATATWNWSVTLDSVVIARNVRSYGRRIECARALAQFMDVVNARPPVIDEVRYLGTGGLGLERREAAIMPLRRAVR